MKLKNLSFLIFLVILTSAFKASDKQNEALTEAYFNTIKNDNAQLALFFTQMPKGGDIHHHYSGAIYGETYLDWAAKKQFLLDTKSLALKNTDCSTCITIDSLKKNSQLYRSVLETWSDLDFANHFHLQDQPDQHFFNTFSYFGTVSGLFYRAGLEEIKLRAKKENVQYIETMLSSPSVSAKFQKELIDSLTYYQQTKDTTRLFGIFNKMVDVIKSTSNYSTTITNFIDSLHCYHKTIDDADFTMRFQTYASRNSSADVVFAKLYGCFDAVKQDSSALLVGVNIVGPENGIVAMRDYWLHMQMFRYLKQHFLSVKTSMHAGELCMGLVKPEDLSYHINDAIFIANTCRVGHGVDIPYETQSIEILKEMKTKNIAIEINLTSNEFILGIKNNDHPINLYVNAGVPIVICTDDAGVSRNNLTTEYVKLASRYHFSYQQIKTFVDNSIQYSFMNKADKEIARKKLAAKFSSFEAKIANLNKIN